MLHFINFLLNSAIFILLLLIAYELILTVPNTYRLLKIINRINVLVDLAKMLVLSGIDESLQESEKIKVDCVGGGFVIEKHANATQIDGFKMDFQKDVLEQICPIIKMIENTIHSNQRWLLCKNIMLRKCKKIELAAKELQEIINFKNAKGVN